MERHGKLVTIVSLLLLSRMKLPSPARRAAIQLCPFSSSTLRDTVSVKRQIIPCNVFADSFVECWIESYEMGSQSYILFNGALGFTYDAVVRNDFGLRFTRLLTIKQLPVHCIWRATPGKLKQHGEIKRVTGGGNIYKSTVFRICLNNYFN